MPHLLLASERGTEHLKRAIQSVYPLYDSMWMPDFRAMADLKLCIHGATYPVHEQFLALHCGMLKKRMVGENRIEDRVYLPDNLCGSESFQLALSLMYSLEFAALHDSLHLVIDTVEFPKAMTALEYLGAYKVFHVLDRKVSHAISTSFRTGQSWMFHPATISKILKRRQRFPLTLECVEGLGMLQPVPLLESAHMVQWKHVLMLFHTGLGKAGHLCMTVPCPAKPTSHGIECTTQGRYTLNHSTTLEITVQRSTMHLILSLTMLSRSNKSSVHVHGSLHNPKRSSLSYVDFAGSCSRHCNVLYFFFDSPADDVEINCEFYY